MADATNRYLQDSIDNCSTSQQLLDLRKEVAILRAGWRFLHGFIKPVVDANTLRLPTALLHGLIRRFREMPPFKNADFIVYHTDEFNYFNVKLAVLKPEANKIATLVGGPQFPEQLGLTGIPYSQSLALFTNCLIPHEMGHYVFGESNLGRKFRHQIEQALISQLGSSITIDQRVQLIDLLAFWIEELFCDCFAVRMVGFCFSLAFVELFDASVSLDESSSYQPSPGDTGFDKYPPDLFRLRQQVAFLESEGWWESIKDLESQYIKTLVAAKKLDDSDFTCPLLTNNQFDSVTILKVFLSLMPSLHAEVSGMTSGLSDQVPSWKEQRQRIHDYLSHGVVPSTLMKEDGTSEIPNVVTLLNASFEFCIEQLESLLDKLKDADPASIHDRAYWAKRVELWTAKAIEDSILLENRSL